MLTSEIPTLKSPPPAIAPPIAPPPFAPPTPASTITTPTPAPTKSAARAAATESASTSAGAGFTGLGFVDDEGAAAELLAVAGRDGLAGFFVVCHFNESEAARAAGLAIDHDRGRRHGAERTEVVPQFVFGAAEGQIADVNPHTVSRILPEHPTRNIETYSALKQNPKRSQDHPLPTVERVQSAKSIAGSPGDVSRKKG